MTSENRMKTFGIYLILLLALLRFLIYPLHGWAEREKQFLAEQAESHARKLRLLETVRSRGDTPPVGRDALAPYLYEKSEDITAIQLDVVARLVSLAREAGGEMTRFDLLEKIPGKALSEAPVALSFEGEPQVLAKILQGVESAGKALGVRGMEINKGPKGFQLTLTLSAYRWEQ